jgi:transcriptional regulator with XRE-family HTH domain
MRQQTNFDLLVTKYVVAMGNIGDTVKRLREERGWSQSELARRVGQRVKPQNIQQLEDGTVKQPRYLADLARAFGINIEQLLSGGKSLRLEKRDELQERVRRLIRAISIESPDKAEAMEMIADASPEEVKALLLLFGKKNNPLGAKPELSNTIHTTSAKRQNPTKKADTPPSIIIESAKKPIRKTPRQGRKKARGIDNG